MPRTHETLGPPPGVRTDPLAARRMLANVRARLFGAAPTPVRVGPYEVVRRLGAGSMGTVFEAYDPRLRRSVALKLVPIPEDDVVRDEMLREAQALARLRHPHVVAVFDAGVDELVWVAMQLLDGCDLQRWSTQPRSVAELLARLRDVGEGLAAVHQSGLVHRDVKPANAFVTRDGRACLVDFGLAVDVTDATTTTASSGVLRPSSRAPSIRGGGGTPAYMAPEQHRAELAGPASDQFAWCVMAWELLYGTRPFVAATVEGLLARKLEGALPRTPVRADVPREVHAVLLRDLAADPRERHADMRTLLDALPSASPSGSQRSVVVLAASALVVAFATTSRADVGGEGVCNEMVTPWGEHARAAVRDALVGDGDDAQRVATAERVDARLGELARAHADARATTCALRADAAIAPAVADRRLACLHRWHAELGALVDALRGPEASAEAWRWVAELDDPQRCLALDEPVLAREPQPPADVVAQVDAARLELLAAGTDLRRRELESARRRAEAVRRTATAIGFLPLVAEADLELARIHRASGRVTDAEDALSEAYFGAHAARHGYVEVHAALEMIALVVNELGRPADAWRWLERARAVDAHGQPEIAVGLLAYEGLIRIALEDYAGAVAPLEEASKRARELGEDHPAHLSIVGNLVLALNGVARYDEAVTVAREHIAVQTRVLGSDHRELAATWHQLAIAAWELGDLATAHDAFTRSIALERRHRGERSFAVALGLFEVGRRAVAEADAVRAVELLDETAAILAELLDERHPLWTAVSFVRADAALLAGRPDEAVMWFERARVIGESTLGADHWIVAAAKAGTGRAALADGRAEQARTLLEPAWAELQATEDPQEPTADMAEVRFDLARALADRRSAFGSGARRGHARVRACRAASDDASARERDRGLARGAAMTPPDDADLLEAWAAGDADAGNRLLSRYFDRLLVFFGPRAERDVEDLVQRTMLSCVRARATLERASSFRAFLFTTAKNELVDHYRRRKHALPLVEPDDAACERTTPSQFAAGREQRRALARALQSIDLDLQIVIALHYWEGMTTAELAETLEIPAGTVKSRLRRAKEALHERLREHQSAPEVDETLASLDRWARQVRDRASA